jgi:hypothetical protein
MTFAKENQKITESHGFKRLIVNCNCKHENIATVKPENMMV